MSGIEMFTRAKPQQPLPGILPPGQPVPLVNLLPQIPQTYAPRTLYDPTRDSFFGLKSTYGQRPIGGAPLAGTTPQLPPGIALR